MSVHVGITGPDGEPLGGWTTTEDGEHIPDSDLDAIYEGLRFSRLRETNSIRCARWHGPDTEPWTASDWSNAMAGEAGEACNVVKKIRRIQTGTGGAADPGMQVLVDKLALEIADTVIYADLLAQFFNIDLAAAIIEKFNLISEREGFPERL